MYNINSPIMPVNTNYQGGVQYTPPYSSFPNGNMIGFGTQGYNNMGGYYSQNYNIYNPYLMEERRKAEEAQRKEQARQRSDMMKTLSRKVNKALGDEISESALKDLYDPEELKTSEEDREIRDMHRIMQISLMQEQMGPQPDPLVTAMAMHQEKQQQKLNPDMTLSEFLSEAGGWMMDAIKEEALAKRREVNNLYNSNDYRRLIDSRSNGMHFGGTLNPNASIDDMEISLPQHLKNEYQLRKEKFIASIINRGGNR